MNISIFVEGNDAFFLREFICYICPDINISCVTVKAPFKLNTESISVNIIPTKGFTSIVKSKNEFIQTSNHGGVNLVVFDADDPSKDYGGFEARMKYLNSIKDAGNLDFDIFLFPNHSDNGDYETLLESIVPEEHRGLLNCFNQYQKCIELQDELKQYGYNLPIRKSKIYSYVDALKKSAEEEDRFKKRKGLKDEDFLFDRRDIWNFDSPRLLPLKDFLLQYIKM
jgi:hypothetical protein